MKKYKSHKIVTAGKVARIRELEGGGSVRVEVEGGEPGVIITDAVLERISKMAAAHGGLRAGYRRKRRSAPRPCGCGKRTTLITENSW